MTFLSERMPSDDLADCEIRFEKERDYCRPSDTWGPEIPSPAPPLFDNRGRSGKPNCYEKFKAEAF